MRYLHTLLGILISAPFATRSFKHSALKLTSSDLEQTCRGVSPSWITTIEFAINTPKWLPHYNALLQRNQEKEHGHRAYRGHTEQHRKIMPHLIHWVDVDAGRICNCPDNGQVLISTRQVQNSVAFLINEKKNHPSRQWGDYYWT